MSYYCLGCKESMEPSDGIYCEDCEDEIFADPEFWYGYFHFCGVPITMDKILEWMNL